MTDTKDDLLELSKSLGMSVEELQDLLKAEEAEESPEQEEKEDEGDEETEQEESKDKEAMKKSLKQDIASKIKELQDLEKSEKEDINKSEDNDLMKAFTSMREELIGTLSGYKQEVELLKGENDELKTTLSKVQETLEIISKNSQGTKGMRFNSGNVIEKSIEPDERDGKMFLDSRDKEGILKSMENIAKSSNDEDLVKSVEDDIIQLCATSQLTEGAIRRLNKNQIFLKEQYEG